MTHLSLSVEYSNNFVVAVSIVLYKSGIMFEYCRFLPTNYSYYSRPFMDEYKKPFYYKAFDHILNKREIILNKSAEIVLRTSNNLTDTKSDLNDAIDAGKPSTSNLLNVYDFVIPIIGGMIILANLSVVISSGLILRKDQEPKSTYLFLGNVAMTDLMTGIAVLFGQYYPHSKRDQNFCAIELGMIVSATMTSIYSVGLIAIDRYLYILYGLKYSHYIYPNRARTLIATTWLIGLVIGFLPLMGWAGDTNNGEICWFVLLAPRNLILLTVFVGVIPVIVVVVLYSIILHHALRKIIQLQEGAAATSEGSNTNNLRIFRGRCYNLEPNSNQKDSDTPKNTLKCFNNKPRAPSGSPTKWKAIKVVLFTTGGFVMTWSPFFVASTIFATSCTFEDTTKLCKTLRVLIASPLSILGFVNSLTNPIIYAWWHKGFRTFMKDKYRMCMKKVCKDTIREVSRSTANSLRSHDNTVFRADSYF